MSVSWPVLYTSHPPPPPQHTLKKPCWLPIRVRRFFGKPKKTDVFLKTELLDVTFGEKPETEKPKKTEKNREETEKNEEKSVFY